MTNNNKSKHAVWAQNHIIMSEETSNLPPEEQPEKSPVAPKPIKKGPPKKAPFNPFAKKSTNFTSSKAGNPGNKGKTFKGGGMKKGT